jgi:hypothetical protein
LTEKEMLVRIEAAFCEICDARETFLFAVNQALRFSGNVSVCVEGNSADLIRQCNGLATHIQGQGMSVRVANGVPLQAFGAILNVGTEVLAGLPSVTVNSSGWVARLATADSGAPSLYWRPDRPNPLGSLTAACLGVGSAFLAMFDRPLSVLLETSLFTHEEGPPGSLRNGPPLPDAPLALDAFLVGCGAVANGWAYAVKRLPVVGKLQAIDRQSVRIENLGPYVVAGRDAVDEMTPKPVLIKDLLRPRIRVVPQGDEWEFFKIRLRNELRVPPLIVCGLDNVTTRHSVQRLWPETLIDIAAGELQSQVIVKHKGGDGQCLLGAPTIPPNEEHWAKSLARSTGLSAEMIANDPTGEITQAEIDAAPEDKKAELERALGKPRCGYINRTTLELEDADPDFAPAVPFVTAFSGIAGAAETMKWLMGHRYVHSLHLQRSFISGHGRALNMRCNSNCECSLAA